MEETMPRELKILLFALLGFLTVGPFVTTLISTGSVAESLMFVGQILLIILVTIGGFTMFLWIGSKIFRE
jgi:chromosome condensin MukBEF MukE localization factor